jgi:hypothetical protein
MWSRAHRRMTNDRPTTLPDRPNGRQPFSVTVDRADEDAEAVNTVTGKIRRDFYCQVGPPIFSTRVPDPDRARPCSTRRRAERADYYLERESVCPSGHNHCRIAWHRPYLRGTPHMRRTSIVNYAANEVEARTGVGTVAAART